MSEKGWGYLSNSPKWHYFENGKSLCGKWLRLAGAPLQDDGHNSPDNCKACRKKLGDRHE